MMKEKYTYWDKILEIKNMFEWYLSNDWRIVNINVKICAIEYCFSTIFLKY